VARHSLIGAAIMRLHLAALFLSLATACAGAPDDGDLVSPDVAVSTVDDAKTDQADVSFTPVTDLQLRSSVGKTEEGRVIRSPTSFKAAFGTPPPDWLDFDQEWLAVYSAGIRPTGGYTAEIERVRLSDTGKTVKVTSSLTAPGADCVVTQELTKPFAVVRFPAQPGAARSRFTKLVSTDTCGAQVCGAELQSVLDQAADGMTYMSESDYPLTYVGWDGQGAPTVDKLKTLLDIDADTLVEEYSFAEMMDSLGEAYDPDDPYIVEYAARFRALREVMEANLTDLTVIRVGEISIDVYFVGKSACGDLVGLKTTSIET
jgi:hypothetical protein